MHMDNLSDFLIADYLTVVWVIEAQEYADILWMMVKTLDLGYTPREEMKPIPEHHAKIEDKLVKIIGALLTEWDGDPEEITERISWAAVAIEEGRFDEAMSDHTFNMYFTQLEEQDYEKYLKGEIRCQN